MMGLFGLFSKKKATIPTKQEYVARLIDDSPSRDIRDYPLYTIITRCKDLSKMLVAGGFPAYLAGFTREYGDVDIFFTNIDVRFDIIESIPFVDGHFVDCGEYSTKDIFKGELDGTTFQLIMLPKDYTTLESLLDDFDFNWCQVGLDLVENMLVYHPEANAKHFVINERRYIGHSRPLQDAYCKKNESAQELYSALAMLTPRIIKYAKRKTPLLGHSELKTIEEEIEYELKNIWSRKS